MSFAPAHQKSARVQEGVGKDLGDARKLADAWCLGC